MNRWSLLVPIGFALACSGGEETAPTPEAPSTPAAPQAATPPPAAKATPSGPQVAVDQLVATVAAGDPRSLFDGDAAKGLRLGADPRQEGVLLRFAAPTELSRVDVAPCGGASGDVKLYVNGSSASAGSLPASFPIGGAVRSLFVRAEDPEAKCLGEVTGFVGDEAVHFALPAQLSGSIEASSTLEPAAAYHPAWLIDGRSEFAWVEGEDGEGIGTTVTTGFHEPTTITGIELLNGYQRSADHFQKNGRLAALEVRPDSGAPFTLQVADTMGAQTLMFPAPVTTGSLTFAITEAVRGSKYRDLVVSELRLLTAEGPVELTTNDRTRLREANVRASEGTPLAPILDRQLSGHCQETWEGYSSRTLKLRADHSFVAYSQAEDPMGDDVEEIFDGSWVPADKGGAVKLYGRRHTVRTSYSPYGSMDPEDTTRVAGGKVTVTAVSSLGKDGLAALLGRWEAAGILAATCLETSDPPYDDLVAEGAVIIEGAALTDLMIP